MVRFFAGMDDTPTGFVPDLVLVIIFIADEKVGVDFNHGRSTRLVAQVEQKDLERIITKEELNFVDIRGWDEV